MKNYKVILFLLSFIIMIAAGCVKPYKGNILQGAMPGDLNKYVTQRACSIQVDAVADNRPVMETKNFDQTKFQHFVPLLIWNQWAMAGPVYGNAEYYDERDDLPSTLKLLMENVINDSRLCSNSEKRYMLKPELLHYYGVYYSKELAVATMGASVIVNFDFFPTGFVGLKLTLIDEESSKVIGTRYLSNSFLFNNNERSLSAEHNAYGTEYTHSNKVNVPIIALKNMMRELPYMLDKMIAESQNGQGFDVSQIKTFTIVRLTKEYDFQEEAVVEFDTGRIVRNTVTRRTTPIISRPGEWVVLPVNNGHWLGSEEYSAMIEHLKHKYVVDFSDNLSAANFYGALELPSSKMVSSSKDTL